MIDLIQVQAAALVLIGASTSVVNGLKLWRNHERRKGINMARWFGVAAGLALAALYLSFVFQAVAVVPEVARTIFILVSVALLIYSVLV